MKNAKYLAAMAVMMASCTASTPAYTAPVISARPPPPVVRVAQPADIKLANTATGEKGGTE